MCDNFIPKGVSLKPSGYYEITIGKNRHRGCHIVLMEEYVGRRLNKNEVVHHKNGIKTDNRIENLELMTKSDHARLHILIRIENGTSYDISKHCGSGEDNPNSILCEEDVIKIFNSNERNKDIAKKVWSSSILCE